jgi:hypothetical protein
MFTPGSWKVTYKTVVERPVRICEHFAIAPEGGPTFAFLPAGKNARLDIQKANARLFAIAPDMYDFIRRAAKSGNVEAQGIVSQVEL